MAEDVPRDKLLHISDLHFWKVVMNPLRLLNKRFLGNLNVMLRRRHELRTERAAEFAEAIAAAGVGTIFAGGDLSSTATDEELGMAAAFLASLRDKGLRVFAIPGNHDVYTGGAVEGRRFERHLGDFLPQDGIPSMTTMEGGTPLVFVPTVCPNLLSSKGRISHEEVAAVGRLVEEAPREPILVAAHYPILNDTEAYHTSGGRRLRNAALLHECLGESGRRILYLAGHVHRFSYTQDKRYEHLRHLTTSSLFMHRRGTKHQGAFTEIHTSGGEVAVYQHWLTDTWSRKQRSPRPEP